MGGGREPSCEGHKIPSALNPNREEERLHGPRHPLDLLVRGDFPDLMGRAAEQSGYSI